MRLPFRKTELIALVLVGIALALTFYSGAYLARRPLLADLASANAEIAEAQDMAAEAVTAAQKAQDEVTGLSVRIEDAEAEAALSEDALGNIIEKLDALGFKTTISEEGTVTITAPKVTPQKAPAKKSGGVKATANVSGSSSQWSSSQVRSTLTAAAKSYTLSASDTAWIVDAGARVAYAESTYRPAARNGQYLGLFQFGSSWGTESQRLDPVWSCYRFVRVMRDGGRAKIQQHWASTL